MGGGAIFKLQNNLKVLDQSHRCLNNDEWVAKYEEILRKQRDKNMQRFGHNFEQEFIYSIPLEKLAQLSTSRGYGFWT